MKWFEKSSPTLPFQKQLEQAEKLARQSLANPSPEVAAALLELAPELRRWGRRQTADRLEQACRNRPVAAGDHPLARRLSDAAGRLRAMHQTICASFDRDSADEEHFPSRIDPRIWHVKLLVDFLGDLTGRRVLDAGCGKGRFARLLLERFPTAEIWGLDLSAEMLRHVPAGIHTRQGTLTDLPFEDASFDGLYAIESLEHAVEIEAAIGELCRVARPGARLVIIDKNVEMTGRLATPEWEKWFGRRELERLLARWCRQVSSRPISYWEDVAPDGLFLSWTAIR